MNQEMSGSGLPLAAQSMVAVRVRSTTFNCGPMSMVGKPGGSWSSANKEGDTIASSDGESHWSSSNPEILRGEEGEPWTLLQSKRLSERKRQIERELQRRYHVDVCAKRQKQQNRRVEIGTFMLSSLVILVCQQ